MRRLLQWLARLRMALRGGAPKSVDGHVALMRRSWEELSDSLGFGSISFLKRRDAQWDREEFLRVGTRFVERMTSRFEEYSPGVDLSRCKVLEIGCGVGRFLVPLSQRFAEVTGVDISPKMLDKARALVAGRPNVVLRLNNGLDLSEFADGTFDFCVCAGVFHHITSLEVIQSYVREGLRVVRPGGMFLFQFMGSRLLEATDTVNTGAKVTARALDRALESAAYRIREVSNDPTDRNTSLVVVIEKTASPVDDAQRLFVRQRLVSKPWLAGVYDDVKTPVEDQGVAPGRQAARLTFFDD
jgi:SAM-dependent methyltransferase